MDTPYEIWISQGNYGDYDDFLASLKGETGEQGKDGEKGDKGDPAYIDPTLLGLETQQAISYVIGSVMTAPVLTTIKRVMADYIATGEATGPAGQDGRDGIDGKDGKDGATGPAGLRGKDGRDGTDGKDGRDGDRGLQGPKGDRGDDGQDGFSAYDQWLEENNGTFDDFLEDIASRTWRNYAQVYAISNTTQGGQAKWGSIAGDISSQSDLQAILAAKLENITGLVTQGANITITGDGTGGSPYQISGPTPGTGNVVGPASATNNAVAVYDGTTGKLIKDSGATVDGSGNFTAASLKGTNLIATRIPYVTTGGQLVDSGNLTYDATVNQVKIGPSQTTNIRNGMLINDGGLSILGKIDEFATDIRFIMGLGPQGDSARIVFAHPAGNFQIDNIGNQMRIFRPSILEMTITPTQVNFVNNKNLINIGQINCLNVIAAGPATSVFTAGGNASTAAAGQVANFSGGATPAAGNFYTIGVSKTGTDEFYFGINKNSTTNSIPSNACFISNYTTNGTITLGRGNGAGQPGENAIQISGAANTPVVAINAGMIVKSRTVTVAGSVTVALNDHQVVIRKTTGAATTVTLPANPPAGTTFIIKDGKGDAATNNITVTGTNTIDGAANNLISTNYTSRTYIFDGSEYGVN